MGPCANAGGLGPQEEGQKPRFQQTVCHGPEEILPLEVRDHTTKSLMEEAALLDPFF